MRSTSFKRDVSPGASSSTTSLSSAAAILSGPVAFRRSSLLSRRRTSSTVIESLRPTSGVWCSTRGGGGAACPARPSPQRPRSAPWHAPSQSPPALRLRKGVHKPHGLQQAQVYSRNLVLGNPRKFRYWDEIVTRNLLIRTFRTGFRGVRARNSSETVPWACQTFANSPGDHPEPVARLKRDQQLRTAFCISFLVGNMDLGHFLGEVAAFEARLHIDVIVW